MEKSTFELKKLIDCVAFICLSCRQMSLASIYGLFDKESGMLVSVAKGHEKEFICKQCEDEKLAAEKEEKFLVMKIFDPVELRMFVREIIIPELIKAIKEGVIRLPQEVIE